MTKSENIVSTIPFTEIESFVILYFKRWFYLFLEFIDRIRDLFIKFVAIPYRSGGLELLFITKGVIEIIFYTQILAKFEIPWRW